MICRYSRPKRPLVALAAATIAVAALACGTFTGVPASLPTISDSGVVFAINGAPPGAPSALHVFSGTLQSADANFLFDIAFDIDTAGHIVVLPVSAVASGLATTHTVSLQKTSDNFDALTRAPSGGYRADTALVVGVNDLILVQSQDPNACSTSLTGSTLFAKVVVTSIDRIGRQLNIRYTVDPNCGFRSFVAGVPKD